MKVLSTPSTSCRSTVSSSSRDRPVGTAVRGNSSGFGPMSIHLRGPHRTREHKKIQRDGVAGPWWNQSDVACATPSSPRVCRRHGFPGPRPHAETRSPTSGARVVAVRLCPSATAGRRRVAYARPFRRSPCPAHRRAFQASGHGVARSMGVCGGSGDKFSGCFADHGEGSVLWSGAQHASVVGAA